MTNQGITRVAGLFIISLFSSYFLNGQTNQNLLEQTFYDYEVVQLNTEFLNTKVRNGKFITLDIPKNKTQSWTVEIYDSGLLSEDYISRYVEDGNIIQGERTSAKPMQGVIVGDNSSSVALTFNDGFVYGFIKDGKGYHYIEPLDYYEKDADDNQFLVYHESDLKPTENKKCGVTAAQQIQGEVDAHIHEKGGSRTEFCYDVDYAIANDFLMFQEFGSVAAVENHAIATTNNVQTNYDDEFEDELQLVIVEQFTVTTSNGDPWSSTTDAGDLLDSFTDWGPGGFSSVHDIGSLWTDRNFDGSTIGIAWVGVVCTGNRYNCLQNFTSNPNTKRVMVAHEIGHNFSANHDASGSFTIMAPSVTTSTVWSSQSINSIDNHVNTRWCLTECSGTGSAPTADFDYTIINECTPGEVFYNNLSTGAGISYQWQFEGGNPATSTQENPSVIYNNAGVFDVTLTVTNANGSDVSVQNNIIEIFATPEPDFSFNVSGTIASFFNLSTNANLYFWDFGDGTFSTQTDPVHDYLTDGVYEVTLTATNDCGDFSTTDFIVIVTPPTAEFTYDISSGCAPFDVQFTNLSSDNSDGFLWSFPGGTPSTSTEENPTVTYNESGIFDVTLIVSNSAGQDAEIANSLIEVVESPVADFSYSLIGNEVTFVNFSDFGDTYEWDFGDGNSSILQNPTHIFEEDGDYEVVLTVTNECGTDMVSSTITISLAPTALFNISTAAVGCAPLEVAFEDASTNSPDTYFWEFEGGNPATSTMQNPVVIFANPGEYNVSLTVTNQYGSNTFMVTDAIQVIADPIADFSVVENGLEVQLTNQSSNGVDYAWDFGDGETSTEENPSHTYQNEGVYTITLNTIGECGTSTSTQTINNYTPVTADFSVTNADGCADLVVNFTNNSSDNVVSYFWEFEGGSPATSTAENPTITYSSAGNYDVMLIVSHPQSTDTLVIEDAVQVSDVPTADFNFLNNQLEISFNNLSIDGDVFNWNFGDGTTSTEINPVHIYDETGTYTVVLTAENECGTTTATSEVIVSELPSAAFIAEDTEGCGPFNVQFVDQSSDNSTSWLWTFEGGNPSTSAEQNPEVVYNAAGSYDVSLIVTSLSGQDTITLVDYITVLSVPVADANITVVDNEFAGQYTGSANADVNWIVNGDSFEGNEVAYTFSANGSYDVTIVAFNECGSDTIIETVLINVFPEASIPEGTIFGCVGESLTVSDSSINALEYSWVFDGADTESLQGKNPAVNYSEAGTYDVELTVSNDFGTSTIEYEGLIVIEAFPSGSFTFDQTENIVDFTSDVENADSYMWLFGDDTFTTDPNPQHIYAETGEYEVSLTITNDCGDVTIIDTVSITTVGIEDVIGSFEMYPNPANEIVYMNFNEGIADKDVSIVIYDLHGRVVASQSILNKNHQINTSSYLPGTYFVKIIADKYQQTEKLVIVR